MRHVILLLAVVVVLVGVVLSQQPSQPTGPQYEFRVVRDGSGAIVTVLNEHGRAGWQVVGASVVEERFTVILQRPKQP